METTTLDTGIIKVTLCELPQSQVVRIMSIPNEREKPVPPEGYTHELALAHIQSYQEEWETYNTTHAMSGIMREIGTARMLALDKGLVPEEEKQKLAKLCKRYTFPQVDEIEDAYQLGITLYEMCSQFGETVRLYETEVWLRARAGFISSEQVSDILKSLRSTGERSADPAGSGESVPQEPAQGTPEDHIE